MTRGYGGVAGGRGQRQPRILRARREDEKVRVFATRDGEREVVRGLTEVRKREPGRRWARETHAEEVITERDGCMRRTH